MRIVIAAALFCLLSACLTVQRSGPTPAFYVPEVHKPLPELAETTPAAQDSRATPQPRRVVVSLPTAWNDASAQ